MKKIGATVFALLLTGAAYAESVPAKLLDQFNDTAVRTERNSVGVASENALRIQSEATERANREMLERQNREAYERAQREAAERSQRETQERLAEQQRQALEQARQRQLETARQQFANASRPLPAEQSAKAFDFKPAANSHPVTVNRLQNGNVAVQSFSPANNPGYGKMYEKEIAPSGETVDFRKWNQQY